MILKQKFLIYNGLWSLEESIPIGISINPIEMSWLQYLHSCINLVYDFDSWQNSSRTPMVNMAKLKP